jgi:hypothetical protein
MSAEFETGDNVYLLFGGVFKTFCLGVILDSATMLLWVF